MHVEVQIVFHVQNTGIPNLPKPPAMKALCVPLLNKSGCRCCSSVSENSGCYQHKAQPRPLSDAIAVPAPPLQHHLNRRHLSTGRNSAAAAAPVAVMQRVGSRRLV